MRVIRYLKDYCKRELDVTIFLSQKPKNESRDALEYISNTFNFRLYVFYRDLSNIKNKIKEWRV